MSEERQPLLNTSSDEQDSQPEQSGYRRAQKAVAEHLEGRLFHFLVILLIVVDATCVIVDVGYEFLNSDTCNAPDEDQPFFLTVLSDISLAITTFLLLEIPLVLWSIGAKFYNPFGRVPHATLHLLDALIIITTFLLEVILRGKEREVASLLIVFRLWRLAKLVGGVAVGMGEVEEGNARQLESTKAQLKDANQALNTAREENDLLRARISQLETIPNVDLTHPVN